MPEEPLGFRVMSLSTTNERQIVKIRGCVWVLSTECLLIYCESAAEQWFAFCPPTLNVVQTRQIVEAGGRCGMLWS